jgi:hypothetical protein
MRVRCVVQSSHPAENLLADALLVLGSDAFLTPFLNRRQPLSGH